MPDGDVFERAHAEEGIRLARAGKSTGPRPPRSARRKLPGIHLVAETKRFYPKGSLAAAVIGYVGTDDKGLAGLEHLYDARSAESRARSSR